MKNVLLLTDFTSKSTNAHHYACKLLTGKTCNFHFLSIQKIWEYTTDDIMVATYENSIDDALLGDNRTMNDEQVRDFEDNYARENYTFQGHVDYDDFVHSINQAVDKFDIELIIIGTNGKTGIFEAIFSSHTLSIVRNVDCSILVIPEDYRFIKPQHLQYILDYDHSFEECGKEILIELLHSYPLMMYVLRFKYGFELNPRDYKTEEESMTKYFHGTPIIYTIATYKKSRDVIQQSLLDDRIHLQVLSAHKENFLDRIISDSHVSKIINEITVPILILRECHNPKN